MKSGENSLRSQKCNGSKRQPKYPPNPKQLLHRKSQVKIPLPFELHDDTYTDIDQDENSSSKQFLKSKKSD